jgi:hypothetical protein
MVPQSDHGIDKGFSVMTEGDSNYPYEAQISLSLFRVCRPASRIRP